MSSTAAQVPATKSRLPAAAPEGEAAQGPGEAPFAADGRPANPRLAALILAARYHGIELDPEQFAGHADGGAVTAAALAAWAQESGMWARAVRISWRHLLRFKESEPVVLLFADGSAALQTGANAEQNVVFLSTRTCGEGAAPVAGR